MPCCRDSSWQPVRLGCIASSGGASGWILGLLPLGLFCYFLTCLPAALDHHPLTVAYTWVPSLHCALSFRADGLSLLFALLISGIGFLVTVYSGGYLKGHPLLGRWYAFLLLFMGSMLGVVLADNLLLVFVFWELTSLTSYLLIGFNSHEETSRAAALQALLTTGLGGLAMLAGFVLLGMEAGTFTLSELAGHGPLLRQSALYLPILMLILAGAFTKSAQFPFHFWLPSAMAAPTPASAYLHSSTMVKAGLYLLARLSPVLGGAVAWQGWVGGIGAVTMVLGAWLAIRQDILKRLLAYSTVSALGAVTMLLGLGGAAAAQAAMAFLFAHALYKAALFLVAGAIDHETGERDITRLGGLARAMPLTMLGAVIAAFSMAGLLPMFGFVAKELVYSATLEAGGLAGIVLTAVAVISSMFFVVVSCCVAGRPFFGRYLETPKQAHEAPVSMWLGPILLGGCTLLFGLRPQWIGGGLLSAASSAILGEHTHLHLALWHGVNGALILSGLTLSGGLAAWLLRKRICAWTAGIQRLEAWGPAEGYEAALRLLKRVAAAQTRFLQNGYLRYYLLTILITLLLLTGVSLIAETGMLTHIILRHLSNSVRSFRFYEVGLASIIVIAIGAAVHSKTRLAAVAALGVVGYGMALIFVLFGAPDLAMTQFVIETLTVILFVLAFYHLPAFSIYSSRPVLARDLIVAISVGVLMGALVLVASELQEHPSISEYFTQHAYDMAHGRNIVNVILVDFRGIDTMGEITVLALAAVGAHGLLKLRLGRKEEK